MTISEDELWNSCSNDELWKDREKRIDFLRKIGLKPEPRIDDPEHYFMSEKEFIKSGKYYGYIEGQDGLITYRS